MSATLKERVAVVTGGSRGLGRAICVDLAARGAFVVINCKVHRDLAEQTLSQIKEAGGNGRIYPADVTDPTAVQRMIQDVTREFRRVDILVNNAGVTRDEYFIMMRAGSWDDLVQVHLNATYHCSKAVIRGMCARNSGVIVNIGSGAALVPMPGQVNYSATKAGLLGFTKSLAREVASKGVRVVSLAPGFFRTDMTESLDEAFRADTYRRTPLGRWGEPHELASLVGFLVSDDAAYITGQTIPVDGGRGAVESDYGF
jgi:3-oxoacyl-[acyl-carrier protein] reductase